MKISEAKAKIDLDDEKDVALLAYIGFLEGVVEKQEEELKRLRDENGKLKEASKGHQSLVGKLYKQVDER